MLSTALGGEGLLNQLSGACHAIFFNNLHLLFLTLRVSL